MIRVVFDSEDLRFEREPEVERLLVDLKAFHGFEATRRLEKDSQGQPVLVVVLERKGARNDQANR